MVMMMKMMIYKNEYRSHVCDTYSCYKEMVMMMMKHKTNKCEKIATRIRVIRDEDEHDYEAGDEIYNDKMSQTCGTHSCYKR